MDAILTMIERAAQSSTVAIAILSSIGLLAAMRIRHALRRRRAFQDFAAAHHLQFIGIIPSDARLPYTRIDEVRGSVLLSNVIEGHWDGLPVRLFEMPMSRPRGRWTTAILVTVEDILRRGAEAERAIAAVPQALIETNLDVVCVSPRRPLDTGELTTWLSRAVTIAKAMERDAKTG